MTGSRGRTKVAIAIGIVVLLVAAVLLFLRFAYGSQNSIDCDASAEPDCFSLYSSRLDS